MAAARYNINNVCNKKKVFNLNPWITNIIYEISKIVTIINFVTENIKKLTDSYYNVY